MYDSQFYLLEEKNGTKIVFFECSDGKKVIYNFDRIGYTPEWLWEDICDDFSGHTNYWNSSYYMARFIGDEISDYLDNVPFYSACDDGKTDAYSNCARCLKWPLRWLAYICVCVCDRQLYCALNSDRVSCDIVTFFSDLVNHVKSNYGDWDVDFQVVKEKKMFF